jgi:hypothetical protein
LLAPPPRPLAFGESPPPPDEWERWIAAAPLAAGEGIVRVSLRGAPVAGTSQPGEPARYLESTDTLLLGSRRAVLVVAAEKRESWLETVLAFAFLERELARLERATQSFFLREAEAVSASIAPAAESPREEVHLERWRRLHGLRRDFSLLEPLIEEGPIDLALAQRQLLELLAENRFIERRLEALDDRLEVLQDQAENAGERMLEVGLAHHSLKVEWLIVAILALELLFMAVEAYLSLKSYKPD